MTPAYTALLLDLDDTLINTRLGTHLALTDYYATHGHLVEGGLARMEALWEEGIKLHFPRYVNGEISFQEQRRFRLRTVFGRPELSDDEADELFQAYLGHYVRHWILFDDVLSFLDQLGRIPVGIVTNGSADQQRNKVKATGLGDRVKTLIISEAVNLRKPQREIFRLAAQELGVEPGKCLMVGDNYAADYLGAKGAGMGAVLIDRFGTALRPEGIHPIRRLGELQGAGIGFTG